MRKYPYKKVDAFTSDQSMGNPAAYLNLGEEELTPEEMLRIGKEHKGFVCEFVFCSASKVADYKLTYYSSECEVDFCGHGTVATVYDLIKNNERLMSKETISIETNRKGTLTVYNQLKQDGSVYITAPDPIYMDLPLNKERLLKELGLEESDLDPKHPIEVIDAGLKTLIVPIRELQKEVSIYPQLESLKQFCFDSDIDNILIYSEETKQDTYYAHTRVFAPKYGYLEDPATGSGNSSFAYYMLKHDMWDGKPVAIEQGGEKMAYNTVRIMTKDNKVLFGGKATVRVDGSYFLS